MSVRVFTDKEKLAEVEKIIVMLKRDGSLPREVDILKAIAEDLRAKMPGAAGEAIEAIQSAMTQVAESKTYLGYSDASLRNLARHILGCWPVIRTALIERANQEKQA